MILEIEINLGISKYVSVEILFFFFFWCYKQFYVYINKRNEDRLWQILPFHSII